MCPASRTHAKGVGRECSWPKIGARVGLRHIAKQDVLWVRRKRSHHSKVSVSTAGEHTFSSSACRSSGAATITGHIVAIRRWRRWRRIYPSTCPSSAEFLVAERRRRHPYPMAGYIDAAVCHSGGTGVRRSTAVFCYWLFYQHGEHCCPWPPSHALHATVLLPRWSPWPPFLEGCPREFLRG